MFKDQHYVLRKKGEWPLYSIQDLQRLYKDIFEHGGEMKVWKTWSSVFQLEKKIGQQ